MEISLRARVRAGDPDAFRQLFDEHAAVVHRHAVRMTGNWVMADDIVSLTFLEAWRLRERVFPGDDSLRPWLLGIATNVARNTARAARRHEAALTRVPPPDPVPEVGGREQHVLVDCLGLLLVVMVTAASVQDRDAAGFVVLRDVGSWRGR